MTDAKFKAGDLVIVHHEDVGWVGEELALVIGRYWMEHDTPNYTVQYCEDRQRGVVHERHISPAERTEQ